MEFKLNFVKVSQILQLMELDRRVGEEGQESVKCQSIFQINLYTSKSAKLLKVYFCNYSNKYSVSSLRKFGSI